MISKKSLDPALHLKILILVVKKIDVIQSLERVLDKKEIPVNMLMDALLSIDLPKPKKQMLQKFIDERFFDKK